MQTIRRFEDLEVWQDARDFANLVYEVTCLGSFSRDFPLRDQINRSAISIPSNIAEGFERDGNKEFINFLSIAKGSAGEARSQLCLALDRGHINGEQFQLLCDSAISLSGFIYYLKKSPNRGRKYHNHQNS